MIHLLLKVRSQNEGQVLYVMHAVEFRTIFQNNKGIPGTHILVYVLPDYRQRLQDRRCLIHFPGIFATQAQG